MSRAAPHLAPGAPEVTIEVWDRSPAAGRRRPFEDPPGAPDPDRSPPALDAQSPVRLSACDVGSPAARDMDNGPSGKPALDVKSVHFCVDMEGRRSRGVQATPPDFRLRLAPRLRCRCAPRAVAGDAMRALASQAGMAVFLLVWTLAGAWAFHASEGPREAALGLEVRLAQGRLGATLQEHLRNQPGQRSWKTVEELLQRHEAAVADAVNAGYASGGVIWNFAGSLLFAVNMLTTIGFGAPVPRTVAGRSAAVIYSAVAIPLHLILVVNFGALVAENMQRVLVRRRSSQSDHVASPTWFSWLPVAVIVTHYLFGIVLFGGVVLFPLLFTTAGGVGQRSSLERAVYAVYLECAVIIAGISINVWRISATSGFISFGLRHNLLARIKD